MEFSILTLTTIATIFYTLILITPAFITPYSSTAKTLQYVSLIFTIILPVIWCVYTVNYVTPHKVDDTNIGAQKYGMVMLVTMIFVKVIIIIIDILLNFIILGRVYLLFFMVPWEHIIHEDMLH